MLIVEKKLILVESLTQGLDDTTITTGTKCPINTTRSRNNFCLCLLYNGSNNFLCTNGVILHQFKVKDSEIKPYPLCLGNISKDFTVDNMEKTS